MRGATLRMAPALVFWLTACPSGLAADGDLDRLVWALQGADARARAVARQQLPYEGVPAVPALMPLLTHDDPRVAQAAFDVLMDIGNEACAPGFEPRREQVTAHLIQLVEPARSQREKCLGLQMLALVAPAGFDLSPLAVLLEGEPRLREKTRVALQRIGTPEARAILRTALEETSEPPFQCAMLNSLGELRDADSLALIRQMTESEDSTVRAAATRALSWTGESTDVARIRRATAAADDRTRSEVIDAWLRLGEAIAKRPAQRELAQRVFAEILGFAGYAQKLAAIAGLGRVCGEGCTDIIRAAMADADPRIRAAGERALRRADGCADGAHETSGSPTTQPK